MQDFYVQHSDTMYHGSPTLHKKRAIYTQLHDNNIFKWYCVPI